MRTEVGCKLCGGDLYAIEHILRACPFSERVWDSSYRRHGLDSRNDKEFRAFTT